MVNPEPQVHANDTTDAAFPLEHRKIGILLANLGTPSAPTSKAVKTFLSEFLHDHRVVDMSRWLWCPLLHGVILPTRSPRVAKLYQSVWLEGGSPLMVYSVQQKEALERSLQIPVELGMTYGHPSMANGIEALKARGCEKILLFPLYPQYSGTTTAAAFDQVGKALKKMPNIPELRFVHHYFSDEGYIDALACSIEKLWEKEGKPDRLLCSYHGIPQRFVDNGDPYYQHCLQTTHRLTARLNTDVPITTSFQSHFGKEEWLRPYTDQMLSELPQQRVKRLDVITPAFSADCLETLEEIVEEGKETFLKAGGDTYRVLPCLNADERHIQALAAIAIKHCQDW